jgi:STE24 endopeptidase
MTQARSRAASRASSPSAAGAGLRVDAPTAPGPSSRRVLGSLHLVAGLVVVLGLAGQVVRPLAPDIGPVPDASAYFDADHLARVAAYRTPLYAAALAAMVLRVLVPLAVAATGTGRRLVDRIVARVGEHRPGRAAAAVVVVVLVATDLAVLPIAFWAGFLHEGAWGFRTSSVAGWGGDWLVARAPAWIGAAVAVPVVVLVVRRAPRAWPPLLALGGSVLTVLLVFAAPVVLEPLRFSTEPLADGPTRTAVIEVVSSSGERVDRLLVADASRRTTKHNAYVSGLGATRRIVLYDTLVADRPPAEVAMILAHELGHQQHGDLPRGALFGAAGVVLMVYLLAALVRTRTARGQQDGPADPRAAAVVLAAVVLLNLVSMPVQNLASRRAEAAADFAALELTRDPATFVTMNAELGVMNLSNPQPPTWVRQLWGTHPPTAARLAMGHWWAARQGLPMGPDGHSTP